MYTPALRCSSLSAARCMRRVKWAKWKSRRKKKVTLASEKKKCVDKLCRTDKYSFFIYLLSVAVYIVHLWYAHFVFLFICSQEHIFINLYYSNTQNAFVVATVAAVPLYCIYLHLKWTNLTFSLFTINCLGLKPDYLSEIT